MHARRETEDIDRHVEAEIFVRQQMLSGPAVGAFQPTLYVVTMTDPVRRNPHHGVRPLHAAWPGLYLLGREWHEFWTGDFIWMGCYMPQQFYCTGWGRPPTCSTRTSIGTCGSGPFQALVGERG